MPRYIDADWLYEKVENRYRGSSGIEHRCERDFLDLICEAPTADVVPISEIYDDHNMQVTCYTLGCQEGNKIRKQVAREIFAEIERTCVDTLGNFYIGATRGAFSELKKKYTGVE